MADDENARRGAEAEEAAGVPAQPTKSQAPSTKSSGSARKQSAMSLALSPASGMSPRSSRNTSPIRKDKPAPLAGFLSTQPSAAAIQRALSASNPPPFQHANSAPDSASRLPRKGGSFSGESSPQWPVSPRLRSPPPSGAPVRKNSAMVQKKSEPSGAPAISVQSATPQSPASISPPARSGSAEPPKSEPNQQIPIPMSKGPSRGPGGKSTLETVQENSADSIAEPSPAAMLAAADLRSLTTLSQEDLKNPKHDRSRPDLEKPPQAGESGSESAGNRSDHRRGRRPSAAANTGQRPKQANPKNSYAPMPSSKGRQADAKQNMTVETETVQSIPQSALATSDRYDHSGSIKLKASNETIRPKKERRKTERRARSINQSAAPTKADLFEARVASAVDEANTSDSDETFVYESNPPEPQRRQRHHSRTPSVTSSHSIADQPRGSVRHHDDRRVGGKRSMKFASIYSDVDGHDNPDGSTRSHTPRHIGRFGRGGHHSAHREPDSPFTKLRNNQSTVHRPSRPTSPGSPPLAPYRPSALFTRKQEQSFDMEAEGADDERTPLMGSHRPHRQMRDLHMGRLAGRYPPYVSESHTRMDQSSRCCSVRTSACLMSMFMAVLIMVSAFAVVFSSNRPLYDVKIRKIENVLATEEELMFNLVVSAVNPNALSISATDLDIDVLAKSKYIGGGHTDDATQTGMVRIPRSRRHEFFTADVHYNPTSSHDPSNLSRPPSHDHGTDPDPDLEKDATTIVLGNVTHFDQALTFEASPFQREMCETVGSLRLRKPGNNTIGQGDRSDVWAAMLAQPFELIVRGVLQYQLPISARWQTAAISGAVIVHPEEGVNREGNMRIEPVDRSGRWEWIEWPDEVGDYTLAPGLEPNV